MLQPDIIEIIEVPCPMCESHDRSVLQRKLLDVEDGVEGEYQLAECQSCGLHYLSVTPSPETLNNCYRADYHVRSRQKQTALARALYRLRTEMRYRRLWRGLNQRKPKHLLEIGCGGADVLMSLEKKWGSHSRITGLDIDVTPIQLPKDSRIRLLSGSLKEHLNQPEFDAVMMYMSLEHFPDPLGVLKRVHGSMTAEGRLWGAVPDVSSPWNRLFPRHWAGLQVPRHQVFFTKKSLAALLEKAGFKDVDISEGFDPGDLAMSICNWFTEKLSLKTPPRNAWFFLPLIVISIPIVWLQVKLFGDSGLIEFVATKRE